MKIKSFYADSMDSALQNASRELGDEALILNTRETPPEFRHFGRYEVVCAVALDPAGQSGVAVAEPPAALPAAKGKRSVQARIVFLVGPSGAGKSSCCAKIAIHSKFNQGMTPAVLSWDSSRIGASDSVRTYCEIGGVSFRPVDGRDEFHSALTDWTAEDLILVDTPAMEGGGHTLSDLRGLLADLPSAEVHLVLSSTFSESYLRKCWQLYRELRPEYLLPTHLDEARMDLSSPGLDPLRSLTIRWCGTGRSVPEDIQDAGQVVERAAALDRSRTEPASPNGIDVKIAAMGISAVPGPALEQPTPARAAIENLLKRLRKTEFNSIGRPGSGKKSSAA